MIEMDANEQATLTVGWDRVCLIYPTKPSPPAQKIIRTKAWPINQLLQATDMLEEAPTNLDKINLCEQDGQSHAEPHRQPNNTQPRVQNLPPCGNQCTIYKRHQRIDCRLVHTPH